MSIDMTQYCGNAYDRVGCTAAVDVTAHGFVLAIFAPNGARMETYRPVRTAAEVARMLQDWAAGKVPRPDMDQPSESKS